MAIATVGGVCRFLSFQGEVEGWIWQEHYLGLFPFLEGHSCNVGCKNLSKQGEKRFLGWLSVSAQTVALVFIWP